MKKLMIVLGAVVGAFVLGYFVSGQRWHRHYAAEIQRLDKQWQEQKSVEVAEARQQSARRRLPAGAEAAASVGGQRNDMAKPSAATPLPSLAPVGATSPRDILARIRELQQNGGPNSQRAIQRLLSDLVLAGPQSLEAIKEYLAAGEEIKLDPQANGKGPPWARGGSLRQELLQVVQEIGGEAAEQLLVQTMSQAASPQEMVRLAQMLEKMAPGKYRDTAVAAASAQLANAAATGGEVGPYLDILGRYGDRSYVSQAQALLVQADGRVNKDALNYLQNVLNQDVLPLAVQVAQDPRVTDPKAREELARVAVEYVGLSEQANQLWYQSAMNPELNDKSRERLIRELEKKGFQDPKNPTPQDVQLAQTRLQVLDSLRAQVQDPRQVTVVDETRQKLAAIIDPNLRANLPNAPKPNKAPR